jgi:hypothetical protein
VVLWSSVISVELDHHDLGGDKAMKDSAQSAKTAKGEVIVDLSGHRYEPSVDASARR